MDDASRQQRVYGAKAGQAARFAACALVSIAVATSPTVAFAGDEVDDDSLVAGRIAHGIVDATTPGEASSEGVAASLKGAATEVATSFSALPPASSAVAVSTLSDPTSRSASKLGSSPVGPTIPAAILPNPTTEEFIASIAEPAREIGQERGLYASVMIAQAILESGSGSSGLSKPPNNNLFGIKGSYQGQSAYLLTSEDDGSGGKYDIMSHFRRYPSVRESLQDYADLLTRDMADFYAPAWKANAATYAEACDYLQGHYATDTSYSSKLQGLILSYSLEVYDHPAQATASSAVGDAVFTVEDVPTKSQVLYSAVNAHRGSGAEDPIDVDVVSKDSLANVHVESGEVTESVSASARSTNPFESGDTQGALAVTAAGLLAAIVGCGRHALLAWSSKGLFAGFLGFWR